MIATEVLAKGEQRFNMVGQSLPRNLSDSGEKISKTLANNLYRYASSILKRDGFDHCLTWDVLVYTIDHECHVSDRYYCVRFKNSKGGYIEVVGILLNSNYYPTLNHGYEIGTE